MEAQLFERVSVDEATHTLDEKIQALVAPLEAERATLEAEKLLLKEQIAVRDSMISRLDRLIKAASPPVPKEKKTRAKGESDWRPSVSEDRVRVVLAGLREHGPVTTGDLTEATGLSKDQISKAVRVGRLDGYVRLAGTAKKRGAPELWALTVKGEAFVNGKESHGDSDD